MNLQKYHSKNCRYQHNCGGVGIITLQLCWPEQHNEIYRVNYIQWAIYPVLHIRWIIQFIHNISPTHITISDTIYNATLILNTMITFQILYYMLDW